MLIKLVGYGVFFCAAIALGANGVHAAAQPLAGITLSVPDGREADPGELVTYCFILTNKTAASHDFQIAFQSSSAWQVLGETGTINAASGDEVLIALSVLVPTHAPAGYEDRLDLTVAVQDGTSVGQASVMTRVRVYRDFYLDMPPLAKALAGSKVRLSLTVNQIGNIEDSYDLAAVSLSGWPLSPRTAKLDLARQESQTVDFILTIPVKAPDGTSDTINITVRSRSTGRELTAAAAVSVGQAEEAGMIQAGEENYVLNGETGLATAVSPHASDDIHAWLFLAGPLENGQWFELRLLGGDCPEGLSLYDSYLLFQNDAYSLKLGSFSVSYPGLVNPGTGRGGLDTGYHWGANRLAFLIGIPDSLVPSFDPLWFGLAWSTHQPDWDLALRLLQTETGFNASDFPYLEASFAWRDDDKEQYLAADYALRLDGGASGGSIAYRRQSMPLGWNAGIFWSDGINAANERYAVALDGSYQLSADYRITAGLSVAKATATAAETGYISDEAHVSFELGPRFGLYLKALGKWDDVPGWPLSSIDYRLGLVCAVGNLENPFTATLEIGELTEPGADPLIRYKLAGGYQFNLEDPHSELQLRFAWNLPGTPSDPPDIIAGNLGVTYKRELAEANLTYKLGLALEYPGPFCQVTGELTWDMNEDNLFTVSGLVAWHEVNLSLQLTHRFNLRVPRPQSAISGFIFQDINGNGKPDPGEPGIGGADVMLDGANLGASDPDGRYTLRGVAPGTHIIQIDCGFDPSLLGPPPQTVDVKAGGNLEAVMPVIRLTALTGFVFVDRNADGELNEGDWVLGGLPVVLTLPDHTKVTSATGQDGVYYFDRLPPGIYRIEATDGDLPVDVIPPPPVTVTLAQESVLTVNMQALAKVKSVDITYIPSPKIAAIATPSTVVPGGSTAISVKADMPLTRAVVEWAGGVLADGKTDTDSWTGVIRIPANQPLGVLDLTVKAWDGGSEPGTAEVVILVESPATQGKASAAAALRIHFATGSTEIDPADYPILKQVAERLLADPALDALIVGHTDNTGGEEFNQQLSLARSLSVKNYLSEQFGISGARMHVLGMGESEPIADDSTAEGRAANRGVELIRIDLEQSL